MGLLDTLTQIVNSASQNSQPQQQQVEELQQAPADVLSQGLREAFDSKDTPSIGNLVGQMFGQSSNQQQAGLINQIIQALGPAAATALAGGVLQKVLKEKGQPVAIIRGEEAGGAIGVGLRYGQGELQFKGGAARKVYWQGPSIGLDYGG